MEDLEGQVEAAVRRSVRLPVVKGVDLYRWDDESGASLWTQVSEGGVIGASPFYSRAAVHEARIEGAEEDPESPFDGRATLFIRPAEAVILPVDIVNWLVAAPLLRPQAVVSVRLAAFAESLSFWDTPDDYRADHPEADRQGLRWVVPTGLYPEDKGGTGRATAMITGMVNRAVVRSNSLTGASFTWLALDTAGMVVDAVALPASPLPAPGAVVQGHFWLCGEAE